MKIIDQWMLKSFLPPLILSFCIAIFVLTLQFFWLYIDEIMGKGVGFLQIIELISYLMVSFIPMALPISILLASVMVFGNLGERYELSSLKSAGVSLTRIMAPIIILGIFISVLSYIAANFLIPKANLKFYTRLYDIRRQKPALGIEEGVFNDDFYGYSIYVGKKSANKTDISQVIVYDQNKSSDLIMVTKANTGKMYTLDGGKRFVMELYNGEQVEESSPQYKTGGWRTYPLTRTKFERYVKSFDLEEFEINSTDESRFRDNQRMLPNRQIRLQIDSLQSQIASGQRKVGLGVSKLFDSISLAGSVKPKPLDGPRYQDSSPHSVSRMMDSLKKLKAYAPETYSTYSGLNPEDSTLIQLKPGLAVNHFYELIDRPRQPKVFKETGSAANLVQSEINNTVFTLQAIKKKEILHWQQFYQKYTLAIACLLFVFIGAPMGAIVRKGGFGYPLLIAIVFFIIYIMSSKTFEKLTESQVLPILIGLWLTTILIGISGIILTYRASKDMSSNIIETTTDRLTKWWKERQQHLNRKTNSTD
jgi:lipopolysaccharide export system permease protein